jgi:hypothetical protein
LRVRLREELDDTPDAGGTPELFDPFSALPGAVIMVPNRHWGFEGVTSADHPGACTHVAPQGQGGTLVKGTDPSHVRRPASYFVVAPEAENGLAKPTAFELVPRWFRLHRLKLYFPERLLGRLNEDTLQTLRRELARLHPED